MNPQTPLTSPGGRAAAFRRRCFAVATTALLLAMSPSFARAQCPPEWLPGDGFDLRGSTYWAGPYVTSLATLANGDLVITGEFNKVGDTPVSSFIARWNGSSWAQVGGASPGGAARIYALAGLPNGDVVAAGELSGSIPSLTTLVERWNGTTWAPLGGGLSQSGPGARRVRDLVTLPNGDLVAGGSFSHAGGVPANNIALWSSASSTWMAMGALSAEVIELASDSAGNVFAATQFPSLIYRWTGTAWVSIATSIGTGGPFEAVTTMAVLPNGNLVAGGVFQSVNGVPANNLAMWDGTSWAAFGTGVASVGGGGVQAMKVLSNGDLVVGGAFSSVNGTPAASIAEWDGSSWHALGSGLNVAGCRGISQLPNGELIVGGSFSVAGGVQASGIARWGCAANIASFSVTGAGCYLRSESYYERFLPGPFDLSNSSIVMAPTGSGYTVTPMSGTPTLFTPTSAPQLLTDDSVSGPISLGFNFPYPGGSTNHVWVGSNGYLFLQPSTDAAAFYGTYYNLFSGAPRLTPMWGDLDPASPGTGSGSVHVDLDIPNQRAYVTWWSVQQYGAPSVVNTFQVVLNATGLVEYRYLNCGAAPVLTGWSPGGVVPDPGSRDLSASGPFQTGPTSIPLLQAATNRPGLNASWNLETRQIPGSGVLGLTILGLSNPNIQDLASIGMPGCGLFAGIDVMTPFLPSGPTHAWTLSIPNNAGLIGVHVHASAAMWTSPAMNAFGVISANGLDGVIGFP